MIGIFVAGLLGTALLARATSSASAAGNLGGAFGVLATGIQKLVDPSVPGIPDRSKTTSSASPAPTKPAGSIVTTPSGASVVAPAGSNPLEAPPAGASAPVRDYNPPQVGGPY